MTWPAPIARLPLHDFELAAVDLRETPSFDFVLGGSKVLRLTLSEVSALISFDLVWPQNVIFSAEVYRVADFTTPSFAKAFRQATRDNFFDALENSLPSKDALVISIESSVGFSMLAIARDYTLQEVGAQRGVPREG